MREGNRKQTEREIVGGGKRTQRKRGSSTVPVASVRMSEWGQFRGSCMCCGRNEMQLNPPNSATKQDTLKKCAFSWQRVDEPRASKSQTKQCPSSLLLPPPLRSLPLKPIREKKIGNCVIIPQLLSDPSGYDGSHSQCPVLRLPPTPPPLTNNFVLRLRSHTKD